MTGRLAAKTAIVTGGGQGIGAAIARLFAREGAWVLVTGRTAATLADTVAAIRCEGGDADWIVGTAGVRADAMAAAERAAARSCRIDVLVNNAQTSRPGTRFEDHDDALIAATVESGLYGTFQHMQAAIPHMASGGGSIINLGSYEGIHGGAGFAAYAATKEAIRGLSRSAARELGDRGIRVNVVCPAALTPAAQSWMREFPAEAAKVIDAIPLRRLGDAGTDIGPVMLFLASDESRYVTGQTINVDGGQMML